MALGRTRLTRVGRYVQRALRSPCMEVLCIAEDLESLLISQIISAITFVFSIACLSFNGQAWGPQVYTLAISIILALLLCAWTVFEIDSFRTLVFKMFPYCFITEEEAQRRRRWIKERIPKSKLLGLNLRKSTAGNAVHVSPPMKSPQRSDSTEMRELA